MPVLLRLSTQIAGVALGLLLTCALTIPVAGQSTANPKAKPFYLDLSAQQINLSERNLYVEQVVDGRPGRPPLGFIYRGFDELQVPVLFQHSLEDEMTAWLQHVLPSRPSDHAVILCIRQMRVSEMVRGQTRKAIASAELVADVYAHLPDGYHFVRSVADLASQEGISINSNHAYRMALAMQRCLEQTGSIDWTQAGRRPARTPAQLTTEKSPAPARAAILRAAVPRSGVYHSFGQFLANRPDTTALLRLDTLGANNLSNVFNPHTPTGKSSEWTGTTLLRGQARAANGDRLPADDVWGFSDGRHAYLRQLNDYRLLSRQGDFYTFVGAAPVDVYAAKKQAAQNAAALVMGVAPYAFGPVGNTGQPVVYSLDLRTGQATPYSALGQAQQPDTAFVYVYRPLGGPAEAQRVLLNDRVVGQLKPGEYLELIWVHLGRPMRLSVGTAGGAAVLAAPSTATANYFKLLSSSAASPWQWMPARQGEAEVDALEKQRSR
ncbi:hypothetical protein [Hymenobacter armeniacus]|uniref:Uncharacterized protein n=1 Tax=Hymenobacter armeniacus TaxID=2771358 RepID=A0ABR8JQ03_9BACT|nr:hypothetical protein [Hymenobacter armeniacus]MBD2721913.1 hypothetical protein [Hymenobacter armeniacus]